MRDKIPVKLRPPPRGSTGTRGVFLNMVLGAALRERYPILAVTMHNSPHTEIYWERHNKVADSAQERSEEAGRGGSRL